jgi:autotransporter-associated beta strand protein
VQSVVLLLSAHNTSHAGSATWNLSPGTNLWHTNSNWTPATGYPNGAADIATFDVSNTTSITFLAPQATTQVAKITFNAGASAFTFNLGPLQAFTISGTGITNNSAVVQNFVMQNSGNQSGSTLFTNSASAGTNTSFTNNSGSSGAAGSTQFFNTSTAASAAFINHGSTITGPSGGRTRFSGTASAGSATFTNQPGAASGGGGGFTEFSVNSTASSASFTNNGSSVSGAGKGLTSFLDSSTAGNAIFTNNGAAGPVGGGGGVNFHNTSTAGSATFTSNGSAFAGTTGGSIQFNASASAGSATFTNHGGLANAAGAGSIFFGGAGSTASSANITNNAGAVTGAGGASTQFSSTSTAGSATLIANGGAGIGGQIQFFQDSTGGTASIDVRNNGAGTPGNMDIGFHNAPGVTIGSLEGSGNVFLGARNLTVGSNNLSKTFSGSIQDGGPAGGTGGSLTKTGAGTLKLTGSNTYSGNTRITAGVLAASTSANLGAAGNMLVLDGGTLRTDGAIVSTRKVQVNAGGGAIDSNGFNSSFGDLGSGNFTKSGSGVVSFRDVSVANMTINAGVLAVRNRAATGANHPAHMTSLSIAPSAALDLCDNDLVVNNGSFSNIRALVISGFGNTTGITSSTSNGSQILALFDNSLVGAADWQGTPIGANAVVGKYTYFGDANIDGQVTGDDYTVIDASLNTTPSAGLAWLSGDMNLDGIITGDDYTVIDANLGLGIGNPLTPSALPEPAAGGMLGVGIALLLRRRLRVQGK